MDPNDPNDTSNNNNTGFLVNDGSFMEKFRRMQQEKQAEKERAEQQKSIKKIKIDNSSIPAKTAISLTNPSNKKVGGMSLKLNTQKPANVQVSAVFGDLDDGKTEEQLKREQDAQAQVKIKKANTVNSRLTQQPSSGGSNTVFSQSSMDSIAVQQGLAKPTPVNSTSLDRERRRKERTSKWDTPPPQQVDMAPVIVATDAQRGVKRDYETANQIPQDPLIAQAVLEAQQKLASAQSGVSYPQVGGVYDGQQLDPHGGSTTKKRRRGFTESKEVIQNVAQVPSDPEMQERIEKLAHFVAEHGEEIEQMTRERNMDNPQLRWLQDTNSNEYRYYRDRLAEIRQLNAEPSQASYEANDPVNKMNSYFEKMRQGNGGDQYHPSTGQGSKDSSNRGHHIGDFLPPDVLSQFLNKTKQIQPSLLSAIPDHLTHVVEKTKIDETNKGHMMLAKMGWTEGQGLGSSGQGIVNPIQAGQVRTNNMGVGSGKPDEVTSSDDIYDVYKKRMMLAYKYRPNPLNNPRKQYY